MAEWERAESPGPILMVGKPQRAWLLVVGEPNGSRPNDRPRTTAGCSGGRFELPILVERSFTSQETEDLISSRSSGLVYIPFGRTSTTNVHLSGTTLCCVPALICVTDILTGPRKSETRRNHGS